MSILILTRTKIILIKSKQRYQDHRVLLLSVFSINSGDEPKCDAFLSLPRIRAGGTKQVSVSVGLGLRRKMRGRREGEERGGGEKGQKRGKEVGVGKREKGKRG